MVTVAAIDCGTNSTRLLVSERGDNGAAGLHALDRRNTITRLGKGVDATGRLDPTAIERTLDALRGYKDSLDRHGVTAVRMTATSAARDATNSAEFFDAAETVIGVRPELLSGEEEGLLSFQGATAELDPAKGPFLVFDIGGGSTEFIVGTTDIEAIRSFDMGCVRVTEKYLEHDPPRAEELSNAVAWVRDHLEDLLREVPAVSAANLAVGLAGTVTTVAAVELGLHRWDRDRIHHFRLTRAAAEDVFRTLATEALGDRIHNPGLEEARADVIVGGCLVLVGILRHLDLDEVLVSESDILDGLVATLAGT
jgi:exopolyphosphatase / guanosine-5'-triphosphate,3'-diphosphate pyrophosphatase